MTSPERISLSLLIPTLDRSGAEKQLVLLATHLPRETFDIEVICLTRGGPLEDDLARHDIPVTVIGKKRRLDFPALSRLKRHLAKRSPDILHTWLFAANSYGRLAHHRCPQARVVVSERCVDTWKSAWQLWLDRRLIRHTDLYLANANSVSDFYQSAGVPGDRIEVIHNAIAIDGLPTAGPDATSHRDALRSELGCGSDTVLVSCIGRLAPQKRISDLIWANELLNHHPADLRLIVVGDGPDRRTLERLATQVGCRDRVHFLGHRTDVASIWAASDMAWHASEFEGQSNSLMEAMAAGLPVVASDIASNAELISDGHTGHLVPVGDAAAFARRTCRLLEDPIHAWSLGEAARAHLARSHGVPSMVKAHQEIYHRLLDLSPAGTSRDGLIKEVH